MMSPAWDPVRRWTRSLLRRSGTSRSAPRTRLAVERLEERQLLVADLFHTISGVVFDDLNANGSQDVGEPAIAGATLNLWRDNGDNTLGSGDTLVGPTASNGSARTNSPMWPPGSISWSNPHKPRAPPRCPAPCADR